MFDFIADLDEFFCEKYANYDKLCILPGYRMPKMQTSKIDEFGRTYAYTLPANTMRLATQEKKAELLQELKTRMADKTFSFSFRPIGVFSRVRNVFSKYAPHKFLKAILDKNAVTADDAWGELAIDKEIWDGIVKGKYAPTKNLLLSLALTSHIGIEDINALFVVGDYEWDFAVEKDVVVYYLLQQKVFNKDMIERALTEYKVTNLFLK